MTGPEQPPPSDPWTVTPPSAAPAPYSGPAYAEPLSAPYAPPQYGAPPYGAPQYGAPRYGGPPVAYGPGPLGEVRATGRSVLLTVVTFGIYIYVYNFKVHGEMQRHSGRGVGGGVALLLTFIANVAMPFVTSSEVGSLYARRGERPPVNAWTGMWLIGPIVGGYVLLILALLVLAGAPAAGGSGAQTAGVAVVGVAAVLYVFGVIAGGVVWFVKTNGALNRYWRSLGAA